MKREQKVQQGKQDRTSSDKLNGLVCPDLARKITTHITYNVPASGKM
jgi:hypothetical protein